MLGGEAPSYRAECGLLRRSTRCVCACVSGTKFWGLKRQNQWETVILWCPISKDSATWFESLRWKSGIWFQQNIHRHDWSHRFAGHRVNKTMLHAAMAFRPKNILQGQHAGPFSWPNSRILGAAPKSRASGSPRGLGLPPGAAVLRTGWSSQENSWAKPRVHMCSVLVFWKDPSKTSVVHWTVSKTRVGAHSPECHWFQPFQLSDGAMGWMVLS